MAKRRLVRSAYRTKAGNNAWAFDADGTMIRETKGMFDFVQAKILELCTLNTEFYIFRSEHTGFEKVTREQWLSYNPYN